MPARGHRAPATRSRSSRPATTALLQLIESLGLKALEIAGRTRARASTSTRSRRRCAPHKVRACLVATNFKNPLGTLMPDDAKQALVRLLARREIPLIEDDIYGDLHARRRAPAPGQGLRRAGAGDALRVVLEDAGARLPGRLDALPGRFRDQVERLKFAQTVATATLAADGDRRLPRARRLRPPPAPAAARARRAGRPRERRDRRRRSRRGPASRARAAASCCGSQLPPGKNALTLHARALERGISIAPGPIFSAKSRFSNCLRVSAGFPWDETIERSVAVLGQLANAL